MSTLDELRAEIRALDAEILRLAAQRMATARRIGAAKRGAGVPLRDFDVEQQVLARAEAEATALPDLPTELARAIMQALIEHSRIEQERVSFAEYGGATETILVVGGAGKMGRWLVQFFRNQGHHVLVQDEARDKAGSTERVELDAGLEQADLVAIATPLATVGDAIARVAQSGYRGVLFDIASLKGHLRPAIAQARANGVAITSIHPMFGPNARTLADKVICLCDCGDAAATARVRRLFSDTAATLVELSLEEHDRIAGQVLGLSHLVNIAFAAALQRSGVPFSRLTQIGSTTFHSQMRTTATVIRENPDLYFDIQRLNPFSVEIQATLADVLAELRASVRDGDSGAFRAAMRSAAEFVEGAA